MSTFSTHSGKKTGSRFDQPGRGRRGFADRLQQGPAAIRMKVRQRRSRAESGGQPGAHGRADQPLVEEAVGSEAGQPVLAEIEARSS